MFAGKKQTQLKSATYFCFFIYEKNLLSLSLFDVFEFIFHFFPIRLIP